MPIAASVETAAATAIDLASAGMLMTGSLVRPMDIFDLVLHGSPFVLLILKLVQMAVLKQG